MMQTVSISEKIAIAQMHLTLIRYKLGFPTLPNEMKGALESAERLVDVLKIIVAEAEELDAALAAPEAAE